MLPKPLVGARFESSTLNSVVEDLLRAFDTIVLINTFERILFSSKLLYFRVTTVVNSTQTVDVQFMEEFGCQYVKYIGSDSNCQAYIDPHLYSLDRVL